MKKKVCFTMDAELGKQLCDIIWESLHGRSNTYDMMPQKDIKKILKANESINSQFQSASS